MRLLVTGQNGETYELWAVPDRVTPIAVYGYTVGYELEFRRCTVWTARRIAPFAGPPPQECAIRATAERDYVRWRWVDHADVPTADALAAPPPQPPAPPVPPPPPRRRGRARGIPLRRP